MATTTISLRELSEDTARAVAADSAGPVIVTEDGRPAHVLLSYIGYEALVAVRARDGNEQSDQMDMEDRHGSIVEMLAMRVPDTLPDDYDFPRAEFHFQIPDLTD